MQSWCGRALETLRATVARGLALGSVALEGGQNPHAALGRINALLLVLQALATAGPHAEDTSDHRKSADMLTCAQQLQLCLQVGGYKRNETQSTPVL